MVSRPLGQHISPECDGSGYMICMFSYPLGCLREFLGVKIDVSHGMLILTPLDRNFYVSWAVTVQNGSFRICETRLGQNCPGLLIVYTFELDYPGIPVPICVWIKTWFWPEIWNFRNRWSGNGKLRPIFSDLIQRFMGLFKFSSLV